MKLRDCSYIFESLSEPMWFESLPFFPSLVLGSIMKKSKKLIIVQWYSTIHSSMCGISSGPKCDLYNWKSVFENSMELYFKPCVVQWGASWLFAPVKACKMISIPTADDCAKKSRIWADTYGKGTRTRVWSACCRKCRTVLAHVSRFRPVALPHH